MSDYLDWQSALSAEDVFENGDAYSYPTLVGDDYLYLTQLKNEQSRSVLMRLSGAKRVCITPQPFDLRTKICEYGGKPFWLVGDRLYFVNQADQCLYEQVIGELSVTLPHRISMPPTNDTLYMYSDVSEFGDSYLLAIVEQQYLRQPERENRCFIAVIDKRYPESPPIELVGGADFYSNLCYHPDSNRLAWVEWDHPSMPWDATTIGAAQFLASKPELDSEVTIRLPRLPQSACACQLVFANNGKLFFAVDEPGQTGSTKDYWNIYSHDFTNGATQRITDERAEFGYPHWQYGDVRLVQFSNDTMLAIASSPIGDYLCQIHQDHGELQKVHETKGTIQHLQSDGRGNAVWVHLPLDAGMQVQGFSAERTLATQVIGNPSAKIDLSLAQHVAFPTRDGGQAFGFYYAPANANYRNVGAPPLIVLVHGGPTARAYGHLDIQKQFWTSRGFALLDVNHRGSSGYGRDYRDALYGNWGMLDTSDIIDGIEYLVEAGLADSARVCIRGKSAGGYAVLRALTEYPAVFKAGASYYGIGNLVTLAQVTHKFEKYYTDRLIDEVFDEKSASNSDSKFTLRSPIHKIAKLKSAMVVFQGLQDKVVPPAVATEVIETLKQAGVEHRYVEYADEGHGFRQLPNNIDALSQELAFYRSVLQS